MAEETTEKSIHDLITKTLAMIYEETGLRLTYIAIHWTNAGATTTSLRPYTIESMTIETKSGLYQ
jgi:hypothetical protein